MVQVEFYFWSGLGSLLEIGFDLVDDAHTFGSACLTLDGLLVDLLLLFGEPKLIVVIKHLKHNFLDISVGFIDQILFVMVGLEHGINVVLAMLYFLEPVLHGPLIQNLVSRLHNQFFVEISTFIDRVHFVSL